MRCRYRFKVSGRLRLHAKCPIPTPGGIVYELEHNEYGILTHISATVPVRHEREWPTLIENPGPGVKLDINVPRPGLWLVAQELRVVEGLLSLHGVDAIDVQSAEQSWLPESDAERERLRIFSIQATPAEIPDSQLRPIHFSLVAQPFLAARDAWDIEVPLSFFRKGQIDSRERRYIEAIYDFYFMLETVYGEGKSKNQHVKEVLQKSQELLSLIQKATASGSSFDAIAMADRNRSDHFEKYYRNKSPEQIIDRLVELRGFLHHHSSRRPGIWHPEDHERFTVDAYVLERIAVAVALKLAEPFMFSEKTAQRFEEITRDARARGMLEILNEVPE